MGKVGEVEEGIWEGDEAGKERIGSREVSRERDGRADSREDDGMKTALLGGCRRRILCLRFWK